MKVKIAAIIILLFSIYAIINYLYTPTQNPSNSGTFLVGSEERSIELAKDTSEVKRFLDLYPDANITSYYISCNGAILSCHSPKCGNIMGGEERYYYLVEIREGNLCLGITIRDKNARIENINLIRKGPEFIGQEEWIPIDSLYNEKYCYEDTDCICWTGCGCDIPPAKDCECLKDEPYCLSYIYAPKSKGNTTTENRECKCIDNTCKFVEE